MSHTVVLEFEFAVLVTGVVFAIIKSNGKRRYAVDGGSEVWLIINRLL